jgi:ribosomal protein S18 acetylase RimI-like enzyme
MLRVARREDALQIFRLEQACFAFPFKLSQINYLLREAHAVTLVIEKRGQILAYVMLLFRAGTRSARVYSLAVDTSARGHGYGTRLLRAAEKIARQQGCRRMLAEVRQDNLASQGLFESRHYDVVEHWFHYYEDDMTALRFAKQLAAA